MPGSWISAFALFAYAATFSFAYVSLSAGTGALLLFGAVQTTMIFCGLGFGERLNGRQSAGLVIAISGMVANSHFLGKRRNAAGTLRSNFKTASEK